jgi:IS605 OrfB family transposase
LGLKHFAVVSVQHENRDNSGKAVEIARYFVGTKQVFDKVFMDGKFLPQQADFRSPDGTFLKTGDKNPSSAMSTLRGIKTEIARNQRQKEAYKKAHPDDFRTKFKYFRLRRDNKLLWERVSNLNSTIKDKISQLLVQIVNHHRAKSIYFEDLKWSSHGKKRSTGRYLSAMQTHWVHSQVQEQVILRGKLEGITVKRLNAAYTSQRCSECGLIEYKDAKNTLVYLKKGLSKQEQKERKLSRTKSRDGKLFKCQNTKKHPNKRIFQLDSDLNASRNVSP